jgi:ribosomal protein S1
MCAKATMEEFEALLNESFEIDTPDEGSVVKGKVIAIEAGQAIIDVGYKMEGRIDLKEFANPGEAPEIAVGDEVEVYLRNVENARGEAVLSREMAAAKKPGIVLKRPMPPKSASTARSLAGSRAASPSIWAVPWPSFPAPRSMCAPCAMRAR